MYLGIIAEGKSDLAVITNILKGKLGIEKSTTYSDRQSDTCDHNDPKAALYRILNKKLSGKKRKVLSLKNELQKFDILSQDFKKRKKLNEFIQRNESLLIFCNSLDSLYK